MDDNQTVADLNPEDQAEVQKFIGDILQRTQFPGISVAMNVKGNTLEAAAGKCDINSERPLTTDSYFETGCINKLLISLVVLELASRDIVDLEKPISNYLPELTGDLGNRILIKNLLSHTAGYQEDNIADPDVMMDYSYEEFVESFNQRVLLYEPGSTFSYSHSGAVLLSKLIEVLTGNNAHEQINEIVFSPLGIKVLDASRSISSEAALRHIIDPRTNKSQRPFPIDWCEFWKYSVGGPWITARDLAKIGRAIIEKPSIFSSRVLDWLLSPAVTLPGLFTAKRAEQPFYVFGLGCALYPTGSYGVTSNSLGQSCALRFDPIKDMVIAVCLNCDAAYTRDFITNKLFNSMLYKDAEIIANLAPEPEVDFELAELAGVYEGAKENTFEVVDEHGDITLRPGHNPAVDQFSTFEPLKIVKGSDGKIVIIDNNSNFSFGFFHDSRRENSVNLRVGNSIYIKT